VTAPRHTSLEAAFAAAVPPARVSPLRRLYWWLVWKLLSIRLVQRFIENRNPS